MAARRPGGRGRPGRRGPRRKTARRWCLPPAVTREPDEGLEGSHVLEEFQGGVALVLWTALRDVTLWATTPDDRRHNLFAPGSETKRQEALRALRLDPMLDLALTTLATLVSHSGQASPEIVSPVCRQVARWAAENGGPGTAVAFAQAAALVAPEEAVPALATGRYCLAWGRLARAETWLRRAIGLARRARDWDSYGAAYVGLGEIYRRTRRPDAATRFYVRASRVARRQGLPGVRGEAKHGLLKVSLDTGELANAGRYASNAQRAYAPDHPRLPELLLDVARLMVRRGEFERAVPVIRRQLAAAADDPARQLAASALLAHATAATGDRRGYESSWGRAWALAENRAASPELADALLNLGKAAALRQDWLRVQQAVSALNGTRPPLISPDAAAALQHLAALAAEHHRPAS